MVLSEAEALARLEALRRQRDAIERQIADLLLYLDLGRRLGGPALSAAPAEAERAAAPVPIADPRPAPQPVRAPAATPPVPPAPGREEVPAPAAAAPVEGDAGLSETVLARRYGRAVIEAALAVLEEAGRPLHAGEILARITEQGFSLPGQDPVAALNTRLWKRSGPGGPLKRLGEAVYAPADAEEG
ncbi:UNVERIFIED_CONTAM: winged helix-turn-helix domain-containing protein [Methylobacteriaceae bacterium AG10]|nr:winged helix-turn-helix domain-containing protein [Methylobacteriaceae bacterium AG10]